MTRRRSGNRRLDLADHGVMIASSHHRIVLGDTFHGSATFCDVRSPSSSNPAETVDQYGQYGQYGLL